MGVSLPLPVTCTSDTVDVAWPRLAAACSAVTDRDLVVPLAVSDCLPLLAGIS